jgi:hypothetical protein
MQADVGVRTCSAIVIFDREHELAGGCSCVNIDSRQRVKRRKDFVGVFRPGLQDGAGDVHGVKCFALFEVISSRIAFIASRGIACAYSRYSAWTLA